MSVEADPDSIVRAESRWRRLLGALFGRRAAASPPAAGALGVPTLASVAERLRGFPEDLERALIETPAEAGEGADNTDNANEADNANEVDEAATRDFEEMVDAWRQGATRSLCVVGPRGSGMSHRLRAMARHAETVTTRRDEAVLPPVLVSHDARIRTELALVRFLAEGLGHADDVRGLEELIGAIVTGPPRIVFVEDLQDLYVRTIGGSQAIEAFLSVVGATAHRVLWIASGRTQSLRILSHQHDLRRHFPTHIDARLRDRERIDAIVRRWNAALGRPIEWHDPNVRDAAEREKRYLDALWEVAQGNLNATRLFWMDSVRHDESRDTVQLLPIHKPDLGYVRGLERDLLFTLLSVYQHGGLSVAEHAEIYLTTPAASRRTLESLVQLGLLDPLGGNRYSDRYDVNPAADAVLTPILEALNLIY